MTTRHHVLNVSDKFTHHCSRNVTPLLNQCISNLMNLMLWHGLLNKRVFRRSQACSSGYNVRVAGWSIDSVHRFLLKVIIDYEVWHCRNREQTTPTESLTCRVETWYQLKKCSYLHWRKTIKTKLHNWWASKHANYLSMNYSAELNIT